MFEFIHDIMESWIQQDASGGLGALKRGLLLAHLKRCMRCRGFALDLVEFSHAMPAAPGTRALSGAESSEIHARVMAAFHRQRLDEAHAPLLAFPGAAGPAIRPSFLKGLAVAVLILAAIVTLSYSYRHAATTEDGASANFDGGDAAVLALQPSPSPTPSASMVVAPRLTATVPPRR